MERGLKVWIDAIHARIVLSPLYTRPGSTA